MARLGRQRLGHRRGGLRRFRRAESGAKEQWAEAIAPIFGRVCAACRAAGGESGTDLSTAAAWETRRRTIIARVVEAKTMPPVGHALSETDRAIIAAWAATSP
jgi:mono/diheme cytochrome c family protein